MHRLRRLTAVSAGAAALAAAAPSACLAVALPNLSAFPAGQCTRWAYQQRPDIVDTGLTKFRITRWDAWRWAANARREGYAVDHRPRSGDIAVWPRNVAGAGRIGHVAYVEAVTRGSRVRVTEIDWKGSRKPNARTVSKRVLSKLLFIHRR